MSKIQLYTRNLIWGIPMIIVGLFSIFISPTSAIAIIFGLLILFIVSYYFENQIYQNEWSHPHIRDLFQDIFKFDYMLLQECAFK